MILTNLNQNNVFFRNLRNSIAHGNYHVDYERFKQTGNLNDISFYFVDYSKEKKTKKEFEIRLNGNELLQMIQELKGSVKLSIQN